MQIDMQPMAARARLHGHGLTELARRRPPQDHAADRSQNEQDSGDAERDLTGAAKKHVDMKLPDHLNRIEDGADADDRSHKVNEPG